MLVALNVDKEKETLLFNVAKDNNIPESTVPSHSDNIVEPGIYQSQMIHHYIGPKNLFYGYHYISYEDEFEFFDFKKTDKSQYGVADSIEQIKEYFKEEINDPNNLFFIEVEKMTDFRWHKFGPYIGNYQPMCEKFKDEVFGPDFQGYMLGFHLYRIRKIE